MQANSSNADKMCLLQYCFNNVEKLNNAIVTFLKKIFCLQWFISPLKIWLFLIAVCKISHFIKKEKGLRIFDDFWWIFFPSLCYIFKESCCSNVLSRCINGNCELMKAERVEEGGWGEWSSWSACSESCGVGIAKSSRCLIS